MAQLSHGRALVVTDMSGFTRTTRTHGIVHMTSLILKTRQVLRSLFLEYGSTRIAFEADNVFAAFDDCAKALAAALQVHAIIAEQNSSASDSMEIILGGVGVDYGSTLIDTKRLYSGSVYFNAFLLGEEIAGKGEVLVTEAVRENVQGSSLFDTINFQVSYDERFHDKKEKVLLVQGLVARPFHFAPESLNTISKYEEIGESVGLPKDSPRCRDFAAPLLRRFVTGNRGRQAIDEQLQKSFLQETTVLMYGARWDTVPPDDLDYTQHLVREMVRYVVEIKFGGIMEEDTLFTFDQPLKAFKAALSLRDELERFRDLVEVTGLGLHYGKILYVPETDVHWGDPVNTASKLGQDLAEQGQIIISEDMYHLVKNEADGAEEIEEVFNDLQPETFEIKDVKFPAFIARK